VDDEDCNPAETGKLCYANISDFDETSLDAFGCACNTFYGWVGNDCDDYSYSSYITMAVAGIAFIISLIVFIRSLSMFIVLLRTNPRPEGIGFCSRMTPQVVTDMWLALGGYGLACWSMSALLSTSLGKGEPWVPWYAQFDPYQGVAGILSLGGLIGIWGTLLSFLNVGIMWLDIAYKTITMNPHDTKMYYRNRKALYIFQVFALILAGGAFGWEKLSQNGTSVYGLIFPFIILMIVIWFTVASLKLAGVLKGTALVGTDDRFRKILRNIQFTNAWIVVLLFFYGASIGFYSFYDTLAGSWKRWSAVGEFQFAKAAHHGQFLFASLIALAVNSYMVRNFRTMYQSRWGIIWNTGTKETSNSKSNSKQKITSGNTGLAEIEVSKFSMAMPEPEPSL